MKKISSSFIVVVVFLSSLCYAKIAGTSLENMVYYSHYIVIAKTIDVVSIQGVQVAEVEVIETLKGKPKKRLYYLVKCRFACDTGEAKIGEAALFFFLEGTNPFFEQTKSFTDELNKFTLGEPLLNIARYGEGRMPIRIVLNRLSFYATVPGYGIALPENLIPLPSKRKYEYYRLIPLRETVKFVRTKVDEQKQEKLGGFAKLAD